MVFVRGSAGRLCATGFFSNATANAGEALSRPPPSFARFLSQFAVRVVKASCANPRPSRDPPRAFAKSGFRGVGRGSPVSFDLGGCGVRRPSRREEAKTGFAVRPCVWRSGAFCLRGFGRVAVPERRPELPLSWRIGVFPDGGSGETIRKGGRNMSFESCVRVFWWGTLASF